MDSTTSTSRVISDLCTILLTLLPPTSRAPHVLPSVSRATHVAETSRAPHVRRRGVRANQVTPAGFASLLFGASFALMLCGSVTFMLGFMLMPWILGFVMLFWFCGFVSNLNSIWRGGFCAINRPGSGQMFSKLPII